jgi:hypothetical protein
MINYTNLWSIGLTLPKRTKHRYPMAIMIAVSKLAKG